MVQLFRMRLIIFWGQVSDTGTTKHIEQITKMREAKTHREFDTFAEIDRETAGATKHIDKIT